MGHYFFFLQLVLFLLNLHYHENEFTIRQCVFELDYENKIELIKYFLKKYTSINFLTIITILSFLNILINKNLKDEKNI